MADKHFIKFLGNISKELKDIKPIAELSEDVFIQPNENIREETSPEVIANYLSTSQKMDTKISITQPGKKIENTVQVEPENIEKQRWADPLQPLDQKFVTFKEMNDHYGLFLQRIQQQMSSIGGSGEVNFRRLDDVTSSTMSPANNNWVLEYDSGTKKVQFTNRVGPIETLNFDLTHEHDEVRTVGTLCWSQEDQTLNIEHPGGVTQQVGQELYAFVRNRTGSTISDGTVVRFDGAEQNGTSRLLVAPFLANGAFPSLYGLGITTQSINEDADGKVTVWGKIRDINTSAWNVGDILYVSPTIAGGLTNIKPTAPQNVIPIAAVLAKDVIKGEIFVRPTITQQEYYGRFAKTISQTATVINTPYPIEFNDTEISNGVVIGTPTSRIVVPQSGFYQFDVSVQVESTSNKGIVFLWFRKNGIDIPLSSRSTTVTNGDLFTLNVNLQISLAASDYVEVIWATSAAGILIRANTTPAVGPSVASALLSVGQIQL
jgi:hypothetical protein